MEKQRALVVGDIHGMAEHFERLLDRWNAEQEMLICVGDYIDRGPASDKVLHRLWELQATYGNQVILLRGNHEQMFYDFLRSAQHNYRLYQRNGGEATLTQLLELDNPSLLPESPQEIANHVTTRYPHLMSWLESLPYYYSYGNHIIVHAGVDLSRSDWRRTRLNDFLWIRQPFHEADNHTGRTIIFGHTPVQSLHDSDEPWIHSHKYGIDGGCVAGGALIGLRITQQSVQSSIIIR